MPRGSKAKYSGRQKRKAEHIEEGYKQRGVSKNEAERRAWATVNKQEGGGRRGGSGSTHGRKAGSSKTTAKSRSGKTASSRGRRTTARSRSSASRSRSS